VKACRVCGCTDDQACVWFEARGDGSVIRRRCSWVAPDLCSECPPEAPAPPLLYDAYGGVLLR
jgi:hypothetical protein